MPARVVRRIAHLSLAALTLWGTRVPAQSSGIMLRIQPRVGDTLFTRLEQEMEMTASTKLAGADTSMTVRTQMLLLSHIVVQGRDDEGTTVIAVTDSVAVEASGAQAMRAPESYRRQLQGQRVRMLISPRGSASLVQSEGRLNPDLQAVISHMPATLPDRRVAVGSTWTQTMAIPIGGQSGDKKGAMLEALYRLDSLTAGGTVAFISVRGTFSRDTVGTDPVRGVQLSSRGSVEGWMRVDRRRGWWTDWLATITMTSMYSPVRGSVAQPTKVLTKIRQRMRTAPE
jgi:hypothetical protein